MKRKEYQKPAMQIVVLTRSTCLLQASGGVEDYTNNPEENWP